MIAVALLNLRGQRIGMATGITRRSSSKNFLVFAFLPGTSSLKSTPSLTSYLFRVHHRLFFAGSLIFPISVVVFASPLGVSSRKSAARLISERSRERSAPIGRVLRAIVLLALRIDDHSSVKHCGRRRCSFYEDLSLDLSFALPSRVPS